MARIATSKGYPLFEKAAGNCNLVAENALNNKKIRDLKSRNCKHCVSRAIILLNFMV